MSKPGSKEQLSKIVHPAIAQGVLQDMRDTANEVLSKRV
jgi:hypothetical protein